MYVMLIAAKWSPRLNNSVALDFFIVINRFSVRFGVEPPSSTLAARLGEPGVDEYPLTAVV